MTRTRKSILEMNHQEAKQFFLKTSSFFSTSLPNYIDLSVGIEKAVDLLKNKPFTELVRHKRSLSEAVDVNHRILANKDGNYAWRPLQILHPLVYVDLVNGITQKNNWNHIKNKFEEFQADKRIECISLPVESISSKSDTAETILNWWENLEQAQISYALEYDYCIHSDITDCYSSMYTHTIPWAVHSKEWAKTHRKDTQGVGNLIDSKIRYLQNGQTNGISQGNVLMDFVAEIVLGYADKMLLNKIEKTEIKEFKILRYRDDYRIFSVRKDQAEVIIRLLSEVLSDLNLKLNSNKTFLSDNIILDAIKPDKIYWDLKHASFTEKSNNKWKFKLSLQKHLLQVKLLGDKYPNCGSLSKALSEVYTHRVSTLNKRPDDIYQLISILVNIMQKNPRTLEACIVILGKLFEFIAVEEINLYLDKILRKFVNTPNTDIVEIWLQRLSLIHSREKSYSAKLCKKVSNPKGFTLWNSDWLKKGFDESGIVNETFISNLSLTTPAKDLELFISQYE